MIRLQRSVWYYRSQARDSTILTHRIKEIAAAAVRPDTDTLWLLRPPRGRIYTLLRREGWKDNHKRVYRLYCQEGLNLRSKRPRRNRASAHRLERIECSSIHPGGAPQCWSMDFVAEVPLRDQLFDGRKIRALTIRGRPAVDNYSRKCLAIHVGQSLKGEDVVAVMERLKTEHRAVPKRIQRGRPAVDNGSEFISKVLDKWAYEHNVTLDFSRPGKPTAPADRDNAYIDRVAGAILQWQLSRRVPQYSLVPIARRCSGED